MEPVSHGPSSTRPREAVATIDARDCSAIPPFRESSEKPTWIELLQRLAPWLRFLLRRLLSLVAILAVLVIVTFLMVRMIPGDPALVAAGETATPEQIQFVREQIGLDKPPVTQLATYVSRMATFDFGQSFITREPVGTIIRNKLGTSLQLASAGLLVVLALSVPLGMVAAALTRDGQHRRAEVVFTTGSSILGAMPEYVTGTFLALVFAVWLRWLPVAGADGWAALVLPTLAVAVHPVAVLARVVRVETLNVLATGYMRTAASKRLPARLRYLRHALPNVITGVLTIGGLLFSGLIGGTVVVENVFARPGLGTALVEAMLSRDYPVIQGIMLVLGVAVVAANAMVDLLLVAADPRSVAART